MLIVMKLLVIVFNFLVSCGRFFCINMFNWCVVIFRLVVSFFVLCKVVFNVGLVNILFNEYRIEFILGNICFIWGISFFLVVFMSFVFVLLGRVFFGW